MTEIKTDSIEALSALVDLAQQDIAEAVYTLADQDTAAFVDLCREHFETIGWASDMAGLAGLNAITNAFQGQIEAAPAMMMFPNSYSIRSRQTCRSKWLRY